MKCIMKGKDEMEGILKLNEKEAIQLTIDNGYNGEEFELSIWKTKGCLNGTKDKNTGQYTHRNMIKFIRKLETLYNSVQVEGKGKKRVYILSGLKENPTAIEDNRKTNGISPEDYTMSQYFYNRVLDMDVKHSKSTYSWSVDCGAINPEIVKIEKVFDLLGKEYYEQDLDYILNNFKRYIKNRNRAYAKKSMKILEIEGKIKTHTEYIGITLDDEFETISKSTFDDFTKKRNDIIKDHGLKHYNYEYYYNNPKDETHKQFGFVLENFYEHYGLKNAYIAYQILPLDDVRYDINVKQFREVYFKDLINRIEGLKQEQPKLFSFNDMFRKYNLIKILSLFMVKSDELKQIIAKHKPTETQINEVMWFRKFSNFNMPKAWIEYSKPVGFVHNSEDLIKDIDKSKSEYDFDKDMDDLFA